jgi:exodeoxyribonuclease V beta subunit
VRVLLIDEFQDTDGLQWEIFDGILSHQPEGHLVASVVVGDPKQAIYSFRGGDIQLYREVVKPGKFQTITGNRRSTRTFVEGANHFFASLSKSEQEESNGSDKDKYYKFGAFFKKKKKGKASFEVRPDYIINDTEIGYIPVHAAGALADAAHQPVGWIFRELKSTISDDITQELRSDLPDYIGRLIETQYIPDPATGEKRLVRYEDICILANSNKDIKDYAAMLDRASIPATIIGTDNVLGSPAALQWRYLLEAVRSPSRLTSARLFAQSWFGGSDIDTVIASRTDASWLNPISQRLVQWHEGFVDGKRDQFFDVVVTESGVLSFLAQHQMADRNITDLLHIGEILRQRRFDSLTEMIDMLIAAEMSLKEQEALDADVGVDSFARRIEGDQSTVRLMTIHQSKGLQFPVVLLPKLSGKANVQAGEMAYRVSAQGTVKTVIDATTTGGTPGSTVKTTLNGAEQNRKGYVALTRAQVLNVLWTWKKNGSLRGMLRDHNGRRWLAGTLPVPSEEPAAGKKSKSVNEDEGYSEEELAAIRSLFTWDAEPGIHLTPSHERIDISKDSVHWKGEVPGRQASYSGFEKFLTTRSGTHGTALNGDEGDYEPDNGEGQAAPVKQALDVPARRASEAAVFGRVIHHILQVGVPDPADSTAVAEQILTTAQAFGMQVDDEKATVDLASRILTNALTGDLSLIEPGSTLADYVGERQLNEVAFSFPFASALSSRDIMSIIRAHEADNPDFADWLAKTDGKDTPIRGILTGAIDTVLATSEAEPRFFIADYKTNKLSESWDSGYDRAALLRSMAKKHYHLQGVIYLVALHRWLQVRLGDAYDYDTHVGGAAYLYLRGMTSADPHQGVVVLKPSAACIQALSELFERGAA